MWAVDYWAAGYWAGDYWPPGDGEAPPVEEPALLGNLGFGDRSYVRKRAREWEKARRKRWEADRATEEEIALSLAGELGLLPQAVDAGPYVEEAADGVALAVEPFRQENTVDWAALVGDAERLSALVSALARLHAELEALADEEAVMLLLMVD